MVVLLVELAESPDLRIVGNLLDDDGQELEIGMPVEVVFEELTPDVTLPQWRRRGSGSGGA